jgi:hypothetical protein
MANETNPIIVRVAPSTIEAFDLFDALVNSEGTPALKDNWSSLRSQLRQYLQITESGESDSPGDPSRLEKVAND